MIKVNQYPQDLRLPTLQDEAKQPKQNLQPLDEYKDSVPNLFMDFSKFQTFETGNAILTNRIRLNQQELAKTETTDNSDSPTCPADSFCKNTFSKSKSDVGPYSREFSKTTDTVEPA